MAELVTSVAQAKKVYRNISHYYREILKFNLRAPELSDNLINLTRCQRIMNTILKDKKVSQKQRDYLEKIEEFFKKTVLHCREKSSNEL